MKSDQVGGTTSDDTGAITTFENTCLCGHPDSQHDAVASRYCAATSQSALPRQCICAVPAEPKSYDRR
jgi:hypothetical protein